MQDFFLSFQTLCNLQLKHPKIGLEGGAEIRDAQL